MSERGQTEAAPARAVESPRPVESQPAVEVAAVATEKLQSDVYKGTGSDSSRVNFNQSVIAASFAPGSPDALREAGYIGGDFNSYRAMMDNMRLGSKKMPGVEREARFAGVGMLPMPDDKGLQCQTAGPNGAECTYKSSERKDGLAKLVRSRTEGREDVAKDYQGRKDHLIGEKYSAGKDLRAFERTFEPGKGPNGLSTEKYLRTANSESFSRYFDHAHNKDKLQSERVAKESGAVTIEKTFKDRADGVVRETTELTGNGAISMREMADGKKQLKVLSPEQLKAKGIDVSGLSTAGDAATRVKRALDLGGSQDSQAATDLRNSKALKNSVQDVLKKTVGEKGLNDPSFDGSKSPSQRDKAVIAIGASTGYEGLKQAGMIVDEKTNSATTTNGAKYTFEKQSDGKLRAVSVESEKSNRKFEFQYKEDGAFKGSIETTKVTDQPGSAEKPGSMKYQNMELPSLQKGWGPYQALQEMQRQGKIQMSQQEMQREAVRIRNREFASLGRNHFKVGDTFQMYSPEEIAQKQGPREAASAREDRSSGKTPERIAQITERERERERQGSERYLLQRQNEAGRPVVEVRQGESIQAAIDKAQEGSIIKVHPGVYKERLSIKKDNISLRGDGQAVIDLGGQRTSGSAIDITNRRNVQIDGFEIRNVRGGGTPTGIKVEGTSRDISLTNNNIHHIENSKNAHGIVVRGTAAEPMRNIVIAGNQVHHNKLGSSETIAINGNVDGFRVINNKVHDNDNIGIDVIGYEGVGRAGLDRARNGIIASNTIFNIDTKNNPAYKGDRSGAGIYVDGGSDVIIEGNHIENANYGIELASEHRGKFTSRIQVRRNVVEGSHLAGISLGGGSPSNGGVNDSIIENNNFRNNSRPLWRQHNVGSDIVFRNNEGVVGQTGQPVKQPLELPQNRKTEKPVERDLVPDQSVRNEPTGRVVRDISDRSKFYAHQDDGHSCSAFSMAMMASDHLKGRPPQYGQEMRGFKALAGTLSHGYRGSLDTMAGQLRQAGLEAKAYQYNRFGQKGMEDLNAELDQGHSAVARVINPHTGNRHYIYVAGRNADGNYILGDPDRGNPSHAQPVSPQRLMKMMSGRDGFVAGWAPSDSAAANIPGTAAYRRAARR